MSVDLRSAPRHHAVIPAAGSGQRLGGDLPKQYLPLGAACLLEHSVGALLDCPWIDAVTVVVAPADRWIDGLGLTRVDRVRVHRGGGATRRLSVLAGLRALAEAGDARDDDWVWVHDAARPRVSAAALARLHAALADEPVGALLALPVADTVKRGASGRAGATVERDGLWLAQTPQAFRLGMLRGALERHHHVTDEASAIEATGRSVRLVPGERDNFKVTTMDDLLAMREAAGGAVRIGHGYDVHALVPGRPLVLGGVRIAHETGLLGHSDADVLLHAVTDALLGGAALGDIGRHFPDSDERWRGADSRVLLREALARVRAAGWVPVNVDCTVIAQAPRLAPHMAQIVAGLADDLGLAPGAVNVKAKSTERLGFAGRGEGIAAEAVALLQRAAGPAGGRP